MSQKAMTLALDALCDFDYDKRQEAIAALRAALSVDQLTAESERLGLYDHPPAAKLTDEELLKIAAEISSEFATYECSVIEFARAAIAAAEGKK